MLSLNGKGPDCSATGKAPGKGSSPEYSLHCPAPPHSWMTKGLHRTESFGHSLLQIVALPACSRALCSQPERLFPYSTQPLHGMRPEVQDSDYLRQSHNWSQMLFCCSVLVPVIPNTLLLPHHLDEMRDIATLGRRHLLPVSVTIHLPFFFKLGDNFLRWVFFH